MTNLLFIDDDAIIRRAIQKNIDWPAHGFHLGYVARDGIDALEYLSSHQPDIILSDIKMPVMDGIEMAKQIKEKYPDMLFIFLSGHEDFQYAKQALKLNAFDFLTKPISNAALIQAVKKAEEEMHRRTKHNIILANGFPIVRRHYISKLMQQQFQNINEEELKTFDICLTGGIGVTGFLHLSSSPETCPLSAGDFDLLCDHLETAFPGSILFKTDAAQLFLIHLSKDCTTKSDFSAYLELLKVQLKETLLVQFHLNAELYFGSFFYGLDELCHSYQAAVKKQLSQDDDLVESIKSYIYKNYSDEELTLKSIANAFHINHCYMTVLFKKEAGMGVYDFLIKTRMEKAKELLIHTDKKVYEIASLVGYSNSQYFSNSFKKQFDCIVSDFRKRNRTV